MHVYLALALGYFLVAAISSLSHLLDRNFGCYPVQTPVIGLILDMKPFVYVFALFEILSRRNCRQQQAISSAMHVTLALALINGAFAVRDMLAGGQSIWGMKLGSGSFGLSLACGLFNHKYSCACITMVGALSALSIIKERLTITRLLAFASLFTLLTFNGAFKELIGLAIGGVLFLLLRGRTTTKTVIHTKIFVGLIMALVGVLSLSYISQLISKRYEDYGIEASIRAALHTSAFTLAKEQFPLGTGAGTFGSMPARDIAYSPLYYRFGIFAMYRGGPGDGKFLMDAWWPHILAESGFVGFGFYAALVILGLLKLWKIQRLNRDKESFFLLCLAVALIINTIGEPTFTVDLLQPVIGLVWGFALTAVRKVSLVDCGGSDAHNASEPSIWIPSSRGALAQSYIENHAFRDVARSRT
jgi:hypothetical protein